ncbi:FAD-binding oxidoreductase [Streptomyces lunaelactis]|uniref:Putative FAD-dependent oxygenase n=1 Tax=Streptomyces lunaelactis TaxID=1535768 RepID=A0A2P1AAW9_9ACTN|nr:bagremycin/ferroverdin biosynthesis FAD-dependent oxygenase BagK/FevA1 [Streptomyces lunaelactis]AVI10269.1 putative FAD-dependent oxygenase [Streptomyces lunaelactis]NUK08382.1 FAD-binding oxidoreductase [Streptomyces lunaelactis]NUL09977.1 FAD-binding oxidoreductase [Streptomyces lunaelactis]NUL22351.1 FAD-binding oxidoreductase [Streptomyces lunaelactis]
MYRSATVQKLAGRLSGPALGPGDDGYAAEVAGFNQVVQHRPAIVVGVRDAEEVRKAVTFAAETGTPTAVQATGHGPSRAAEGAGLLINTRRMTKVTIDPVARVARAEAGTQWHQVVEAAAGHGLAPLNGSSPLVGVVGYTLGGGLALLSRAYGFAADHVTTVEVVTPDGRPRTATAQQNTDLFWALRGGKGNFGVVTAIEFGLVPVPRFYGGGLFFPGETAAEVLHAWRLWTESVPEEMASSLALLRMPDLEPIPEFLRGKLVVHIRIAHLGPGDEGERLVGPLRKIAPALVDTLAEMPYQRFAEIHNDPTFPIPYDERSTMLRELGQGAADDLLSLVGPGSDCTDIMVELRHMGGALSRPPSAPSAVDHREAAFCLSTLGLPGGRPAHVVDGMARWGTGRSYLNFLAGPETAQLAERGYGPATYARLGEIKARYDPENLFRFNHNIPPRAKSF